MDRYSELRRRMVDCQVRTFDVTDRAVLAAMDQVPREIFMPPGREALTYGDANVGFADPESGDERVMLSPMVLGRMLQALEIEDGCKALDVAGGFGYSAALLARLGCRVTALEASKRLETAAAERLGSLGYGGSIRHEVGPLAKGAPGEAPFDVILLNGAVEEEPAELLGQLAETGRLVCLRAEQGAVRAVLYVRAAAGSSYRSLFDAPAPILAEFRRAPAFTF